MALGLTQAQYLFLIIIVFSLTMIIYGNIRHHHQTYHEPASEQASGTGKLALSRAKGLLPGGGGGGQDAGNRRDEKDVHPDVPDKDVAILPGIRKFEHPGKTADADSKTATEARTDTERSLDAKSNIRTKPATVVDADSVPLKKKTDEPNLHAVTYASHGGRDDRFCRAVESAVRNKFDLIILGWGVPWRGLSQKLEAAHGYAKSLPPRDIILFTDAFDVLFTGDPEEIKRIFLQSNATVIFSAECGCWPHVIENGGRDCFQRYPQSPTPYRYLNSGAWIGYAAQAAQMLEIVIKEAGNNFANANDQKLMADLFMSKRVDIQLDYYNTIFQSMHMTLDPPLKHCNPVDDLQFDSVSKRWVNRVTHGKPAVIHFNGGGKKVHLPMEAKSWYKDPESNTQDKKKQLGEVMLKAPLLDENRNRQLSFKDLCKSYLN
jgi:hypothetical protein